MESEHLLLNPASIKTSEWFSEEYIRNSISKYLKQNGYKIHKSTTGEDTGKSIIASKFFKKEIIEVKGYPKDYYTHTTAKGTVKNSSALQQAKHWFSEALFNSFTNFGQYYTGENVVLAIALPNVERYKAIIERVHEYFTMNDLSFKIYLVNETGDVEVANLNAAV
jgi:hypothetical protein